MIPPTLDKCAAAIAEVFYPMYEWSDLAPANQAHCVRAARACIGALLPVNDGMIEDMLPGIPAVEYPTPRASLAVVTAALTAVLGEEA